MSIFLGIIGGAIVGYLPGAVIFRLPVAHREKRAALAAEERVFWQAMISIAWSLSMVMAMAAIGIYRYDRVLAVNVVCSLGLIVAARGGLRWRGAAARLTIAALVPLILLALGVWRFFPASEYILGGKDPGVYVNEGVAIDRTGQLFRRDAVVASVPESSRDLFFPSHHNELYYGLRFMGVYIDDPSSGSVIVGFPQLYPASVAVGDRLAGTAGATNMVALWATLGVLAVYFFGARLVGRLPAFFGAVLLALNVIEVWFGRYPNTEVVMQTLLFAGLLALARGHQDDDPFFAWVAGVLIALLIFLRFDAFLAIAGIGAALAGTWIVQGQRPRWGFVLPLVAGTGLGLAYYLGPMKQYFYVYRANLPSLPVGLALLVVAATGVWGLGRQRARLAPWLTRALPMATAGILIALAGYALFLRHRAGLLADHDAYSLRTFRDAYVFWPALIAALAGYALVARREFWRDPAFFLVLAGFSVFFFYKIRVMPEQFWMARRFLPMILPGTLLLAAAAAFGPSGPEHRRTVRRAIAATAFVAFVGWQYAAAAKPVAAHVEYKGAIRQVDQLARRFTDRDLVIMEGRNAGGDCHVLALPLADQYGLQVLVLDSPVPDHRQFESFLEQALTKYDRVFFVACAGTQLLSRRVDASPVALASLWVPEYETTNWDAYPRTVQQKDLRYSVYRLTMRTEPRRGFLLDVGYFDDLNVVRFFPREVTEGRSVRWTGAQSFISVTGITGGEREIEFVLHDGGRPAGAGPATLDVFFNETPLGRILVANGFRTYRLAIPADAARLATQNDNPVKLRLVSSVWSPRDFVGGTDDRQLGVMIDRVEIH